MRIMRAVTLTVTTATLMLGLMAPATSTPEKAGQCAGDGTKVQGQGESTVDVDGTMVTATISDQTVTFTDSDGQPIDVTFCVKASDDNSGTHTGSSWTVQLENDGGQNPAISHVVLYSLAESADTDTDDGTDTDAEGDAATDGDTDADSDAATDDGADTDAEGDAAGTTVPPDADSDDDTNVAADELTRGTTAPGTDDDTEVLDGTVGAPDADGTVGAADGTEGGSDRLAATGLPVLILVLMGLVALVAGTGVLTAARRR